MVRYKKRYTKRKRTRPGTVPYAKRGYLRTEGFYKKNPMSKELKWNDEFEDNDGTPISALGDIVSPSLVNTIVQATGPTDRVGRQITVKAIGVTIIVIGVPKTNSLNTGDTIRVILYQDKQTNGAAAIVSDILKGAPIISIASYRNLENVSRFQILWDKLIQVDPYTTVGTSSARSAVVTKFYKRCNVKIEYSGPDNSIANIRSNNFGILCIAEHTGQTSVQITTRVRYTDM